MVSNVELALFAVLDDLGEELKEKEREVDQSRRKVVHAQAEARNAEKWARYAAYDLRIIDRELDIVVGLYNRNRLESLSLRLDKLRNDREPASQRSEFANILVRDRQHELHRVQTVLVAVQGELKKKQEYQKKLYALLRQKRKIL